MYWKVVFTVFDYSFANLTKSLLATKGQEAGGSHFLFDKTCKDYFFIPGFIKYKLGLDMFYGRLSNMSHFANSSLVERYKIVLDYNIQ